MALIIVVYKNRQKMKMNSQDPLMRRIDGSHMIPPSAVNTQMTKSIFKPYLQLVLCQVIHHRLPIKRPNRFTSWISNFQFQVTSWK